MYEFHGWAVLNYHTHDTNESLQDELMNHFAEMLIR